MGYKTKLVLFVCLAAIVCIKGSELYSAHSGYAMPHDKPQETSPGAWAPLKDPAEEFRGVSPRPDLAVSLPLVKNGMKAKKTLPASKKVSSASNKSTQKKSVKKN